MKKIKLFHSVDPIKKADIFRVRLIGIIFNPRTRKILLEKNTGEKEFSFLDGGLRHNEELDKALKRMIFEKTGFKVHNLGAVYAENMLPERYKLKLYFLCEATEGTQKIGPGVDDLKWISPKDTEKTIKEKLPPRLKEYLSNLA